MLISVLILIGSVIILYFGAEFSLDASEKIGKKLGLSPLVIGMVLIGFGTSLPEFFVAHIAGSQGKPDIAIGSLVGSNIANLLLVLGVSSLIARISIENFSVKKQTVVHLILSFVLVFTLSQSQLTILTAIPLLLLCCFYMFILFFEMKSSVPEVSDNSDFNYGKVFFKLIFGFSFLYLGGELLVKSGTALCLELGISEYVISAIFIAFGTSFPELVTSVLAAIKKKDTDLIVGNIIGSNLFNCAFILGSLGIYNFEILKSFKVELIALVCTSIFLVILSFAKIKMYRLTGTLFLLAYICVVGQWLNLY